MIYYVLFKTRPSLDMFNVYCLMCLFCLRSHKNVEKFRDEKKSLEYRTSLKASNVINRSQLDLGLNQSTILLETTVEKELTIL